MGTLDLDTFLVTVYCLVDTLYVERFGPQKLGRPGVAPELADSEVLTLLALAQWQKRRSERAFVRYASQHWRPYFPRLLSQSAFNRRARDLRWVLCQLGPAIGEQVIAQWTATHQTEAADGHPVPPVSYEVFDGVLVPLARRCRGLRHKLFSCEEAGLGCGGSDQDWYFGVELLGVVHPAGVFTGFVIAPADTGERWQAEALLRWRHDPTAPQPTADELAPVLGKSHRRGGKRLGPTGPVRNWQGAGQPTRDPYLVDLGFRGQCWQAHWQAAYGATVLTKADVPPDATPAQQHELRRLHCGRRQLVETTFGGLDETFGLKFPRARTMAGLLARLGAKLAAFNLAVYVNCLFGREPFAFFDPLAA